MSRKSLDVRWMTATAPLTTNRAFSDWHAIFPNATCATALVERVIHHADIVKIEGESYRLRESKLELDKRCDSRRKAKKS